MSELTGNCHGSGRGGVCVCVCVSVCVCVCMCVCVCTSWVHTYLRRHWFPVVQPPKHLPTSISCGKLATQREGNELTAGHKYWPSWAGGPAAVYHVNCFDSTPAGAICVCTPLAPLGLQHSRWPRAGRGGSHFQILSINPFIYQKTSQIRPDSVCGFKNVTYLVCGHFL